MMAPASRRTFIRIGGGTLLGTLAGALFMTERDTHRPALLRPPGAVSETQFLSRCVRCCQCIRACPAGVLQMTLAEFGVRAGTPFVNAREKPCDLCFGRDEMKCIPVCPTEALQPIADRTAVRMGVAIVDTETCLPYVGVSCRACWHACPFPDAAISVDDTGHPLVHQEACVGCGLCEHACLTDPPAIRIAPFGATG